MNYLMIPIFPINESYWKNMKSIELNNFKNNLFKHYRLHGFPYYKVPIIEQFKKLKKMDDYCNNHDIIQDDIIRQTMHCLDVAWTYFPKSWEVVSNNKKTPMELFSNDELFKKVITKRLKRGTYWSDNGLRKELKAHSGSQGVSNFRPSVARAIYDKFAGDGMVYDPCMGYGGRLLGAISSNKVKYYDGCDPSTDTYNGLLKMASQLGGNTFINLNHIGAEDYKPVRKFDLISTSPPYYDTEKYSNEPTQSYIKYPTYSQWLNGFLKGMLDNSINCLKTGGHIIINIANTRRAPTLETDFINMMMLYDVVHVITYKMQLSSINKIGHKYEPIFVFRKK